MICNLINLWNRVASSQAKIEKAFGRLSRQMTKDNNYFPDPIQIPIEDSIDLHTFSPKEISSLLEEYLKECIKAGIYEVRIIHGKGKGYQRRAVHSFLEKSSLVQSFSSAPATFGGWGATIAVLRRV